MRILIVGGSDAGISAALRARELDSSAEIAVLLADDFPNWSVCGLPYYLGGETPDWRSLAHRTEFEGIEILRGHRAQQIDATARTVAAENPRGVEKRFSYDRLVVATGAKPIRPDLPGMELRGVYLLHTMGDALAVNSILEAEPAPRSVLVVGAGYIGLEMAEAFAHRGLRVAVLSRSNPVFPTVDPEFGREIDAELRRHAIQICTGAALQALRPQPGGRGLLALASDGAELSADVVLVAAGVRPDTDLAARAGAELGVRGAIAVDRSMRTSLPDVLAAGDCVETWHRVLGRATYLPLGTTAHKQGRVAGESAVGGTRQFAGSVGTQVVKLFDLAVARTGLLDREAREAGFEPETVETEVWDHKAYYPGASRLRLRVMGDRRTGQLLSAQILGPRRDASVAKRIDVFATALFHAMRVEEIADLDLSYAPPFSSPWDPVQIAAQAWNSRKTG